MLTTKSATKSFKNFCMQGSFMKTSGVVSKFDYAFVCYMGTQFRITSASTQTKVVLAMIQD